MIAPTEAQIEEVAKQIYMAMRFERLDSTPAWEDRGNSLAQSEARFTARAVLGGWGRAELLAAKLGVDLSRPATPPAPEPGEVGELVEFLTPTREQAGAISFDAFLKLRRAAILLQQQESELAALVQQLAEPAKALVVPVNEQPWNRPGWCDAEGRCWFCNSYSMGSWNYDTPPDPAQDWGRLGTVTHSAPHWAIPRPGRMPELPSLSVYSYDAGESVRISRMGESNCWCIIASGLIPDWWFNLEMHYDFASAGAALAAIRLARQIAKKSEEA